MQIERALRSADLRPELAGILAGLPQNTRSRVPRLSHPAKRALPRKEPTLRIVLPATSDLANRPDETRTTSPVAPSPSAAPEGRSRGAAAPFSDGRRSTANDRSALGIYLRQVRAYPILTREEEHELALRLAQGPDPAVSARLITANLRLVVKIAREYRRIHNNLLDLIQEGNVGLIHAIRKYDPNRGVRVCSYASWWIRAYILKFILSNWRLIKVGTTQAQRRIFFNLHKERHKLDLQGAEVDTKQLAAALYVTEDEVVEMEHRLNASELSIDAPGRAAEQGDRTRGLVLSASTDSRPDLQIETSEFARRLRQKVDVFGAALRDRELEIFAARITNDEPTTLSELAGRFGVTRERARQIEARLKRKLRTYLEEEMGESLSA